MALSKDQAKSFLGPDLLVQGSVIGKLRLLRIEAAVDGDVRVQGEVQIGKAARVRGKVIAERVSVEGMVVGQIHAKRSIVVRKTGQVYASLESPSIAVEPGGVLGAESEAPLSDLRTVETPAIMDAQEGRGEVWTEWNTIRLGRRKAQRRI